MAQDWTEEQLFEYYQNKFKKIYGDLVAVIGTKPLEISFEIEAVMSHISVAKTHPDPLIVKQNISKAAGHIQRATLDAVKILWLEYRARTQPIIKDKSIRKFCTLVPESEFITRYNRAESLAINARRKEIENVGIKPEESVDDYYKAVNEYRNLLDTIDWERVESFKKYRWFYLLKQQSIGFLLGIISSALVAVWGWKYLPAQVPPSAQTADKPQITMTKPNSAEHTQSPARQK